MALTDRQVIAVNLNFSAVPRSFEHTPAAGKPTPPGGAFAFTADASTDLLTTTAHGLLAGDRIRVSSATTLPAGLSAATDYYVIASGLTANDFKVSATAGGSAVNITSGGTGTHSWQRYLTAAEQAEFETFLTFVTNGSGRLPFPAVLLQAISLITAYGVYHQRPAYKAWWHDNEESRDAQYRLRKADTIAANDTTIPVSGDPAGDGDNPPTYPIPRYDPP